MKLKIIFVLLLGVAFLILPSPSFVTRAVDTPVSAHKAGELVIDSGTVYLIEGGKRRGFPSEEEFFSHGYVFSMVLPANAQDMKLPEGERMRMRAGSVVLDRADGITMYYLFEDGAHPFPSLTEVYMAGLEGRGYYEVDLSSYDKAAAIDFNFLYNSRPPGALVNIDGTVFLVIAGGLAAFPSVAVFDSHGYDFAEVYYANELDKRLKILKNLGYRDGTLVNDNGTVFLIAEGKKYGFKTWDGFLARGHRSEFIVAGETSGYVLSGTFD
ncbi:MAG: hypothetical protein HY397_01390 [Candidatus Doudnabacteria bacterium]|nr:hypothetical protein [Candidatus Doudnabacteria bacterium]